MLRQAKPGDCEAVYRLICEMEGKELAYDRFSSVYREQLDDGRYSCIVWEEDGAVLGMLNLRFEKQLHHAAAIAEVLELVVAPACRGQGAGKKLLETACRTAAEHGCVQIEVACNQLRADAHRFYLREGMNNYHYKFSKPLLGADAAGNRLGR